MQRFAGITGSIIIIVCAFFTGYLPMDGNPIGYHLSGFAKMGQQASVLSSCSTSNPCNLAIDIYFNTAGAPASTPPNCASSCFSFQNLPDDNLQLDHVTFDGAYAGSYTVWINGGIAGSPNAAPRPAASSRPNSPH